MRPSKLTEETKSKLLNCIRLGLTIKSSCHIANITETTYFRWKILGRNKNPKRLEFSEFCESLKRAEEEAKAKLLSDIQRDESWQSKAWILERRWPNEWGRTERVNNEHSGAVKFIIEWPKEDV